MASYPEYLVGSALGATGWPRKTSLFGPKGVDGSVLGHTVTQMVQVSVALGAGRPFIASQLLTQMFGVAGPARDPWEHLLRTFDPTGTVLGHPQSPPWGAILHQEAGMFVGFIPWKDVLSKETLTLLFARFNQGLIYGLTHPESASEALDAERFEYAAGAPEAVRAGAHIPLTPPWPDNDAYFAWIEETVRAYERTTQPLPQPDLDLLKMPVVRGRLSSR